MDSSETSELRELEWIQILQRYAGGKVRIWDYERSLSRLTLRLSSGEGNDLYLVCGQCIYISGPFRWDNSALRVATEVDEAGEEITVVSDASAGFQLQGKFVVVVENEEPRFISEG